MAFIPKENDSYNKWYSSKDYQSFRQTLVRDAIPLSKEINDTSASHECTGLEVRVRGETGQFVCVPLLTNPCMHQYLVLQTFISTGFARLMHGRKCAHRDAVLLEQRLQELKGVFDVEKLSRVSRKTSSWATNRAAELASGYRKLLDE